MFDECLILIVLKDKELSAIQIAQAIETFSHGQAGQATIGGGRLYIALYELEQSGLIQSRWGNKRTKERGGLRRLYYSLTQSGQKYLFWREQDNQQEGELCHA